jgi:hypothetical protein
MFKIYFFFSLKRYVEFVKTFIFLLHIFSQNRYVILPSRSWETGL